MVSTIYQRFTYWFAPLFITVFVLSYQNCSDVAFQRVGGSDVAPTGQACLPVDFNLQVSVPIVTLDTPVTFSANPPAANTSYTWDLNGVEVGQGPSMVRTFTQGGSYAMRVTALMDDCENPRSKTVNFFIDGGVTCDLSGLALSGDSNGMVAETLDYAVNTNCNDLTFGWNAGDGTTITNTSNTMDHAWMWPGIFIVSTDVVSSSAQRRLSMPVSIQQACPTLQDLFVTAPDVAYVNDQVPFELVIPGCLDVLSMNWSFGNSSSPATASGRAVSTQYSATGVKNATVRVSTKDGSVELPHRITILDNANPCDETLLTLTGPTVGNVGESLRYGVYVPTCMNATAFSWNFGDATAGSTNPINKIYNAAGEYRVSVIVTTTAHGFITLSRRVVIHDVVTYSWVESWGTCSGPCGDGLGTQSSSFTCRDSSGDPAPGNCTQPMPISQTRSCTVPANTCTCTPPQVNVNGVCVTPTTTCNVLVGTNNIGTVNNGATVTRWRSNPGSGQCGTRCQSQTLTCTAPNNVVFDASYIHANQNACMVANPCTDGLCKSPPHGSTLTSPPAAGTANLCSAGTASAVTTGASTYNWTCAGSAGGLTDNCFANIGTVTCPAGYHLNASNQCVKWNYTPSGCSSNICGQSGVTIYTSSCINTSSGAATGCNPSLNQPPQNVTCSPNPTSCVCPQGQVNVSGVCRTPVNGACLNPNPRVITSSQALPNPLCQAGDANPASFTVPVGGTTTYSCVGQYTGSTAQNCKVTRCLSGYSVVNNACVQNVTYSWRTGDWGACTGQCGSTGTQNRTVQCYNDVTNTAVLSTLCNPQTRPSESQPCAVSQNSCTCTPPSINDGGTCVDQIAVYWSRSNTGSPTDDKFFVSETWYSFVKIPAGDATFEMRACKTPGGCGPWYTVDPTRCNLPGEPTCQYDGIQSQTATSKILRFRNLPGHVGAPGENIAGFLRRGPQTVSASYDIMPDVRTWISKNTSGSPTTNSISASEIIYSFVQVPSVLTSNNRVALQMCQHNGGNGSTACNVNSGNYTDYTMGNESYIAPGYPVSSGGTTTFKFVNQPGTIGAPGETITGGVRIVRQTVKNGEMIQYNVTCTYTHNGSCVSSCPANTAPDTNGVCQDTALYINGYLDTRSDLYVFTAPTAVPAEYAFMQSQAFSSYVRLMPTSATSFQMSVDGGDTYTSVSLSPPVDVQVGPSGNPIIKVARFYNPANSYAPGTYTLDYKLGGVTGARVTLHICSATQTVSGNRCIDSVPLAPEPTKVGCYIDTPAWDTVEQGGCSTEMNTCTATNYITYSVGNEVSTAQGDRNNFFTDASKYSVSWTGACTGTGSMCSVIKTTNGNFLATARVTRLSDNQVWTYNINANKRTTLVSNPANCQPSN